MLREMTKQELAFFDSEQFQEYAVTYNMVYQHLDVIERVLTDEEKKIMILFATGKSMLIWSDKHLDEQKKKQYMSHVLELMVKEGKEVKGIFASKDDLPIFFGLYQEGQDVAYEREEMLSYSCSNLILPKRSGRLIKADKTYIATVANFIEQFEKESFGSQSDPKKCLERSRNLIQIGQAYLWQHDGHITAMGLLSGQSKHVGRINYIYVDKAFRRKGYAQMLVASLCEILQKQNRLPVLYAMKENDYSNKAYKNIGFEMGGQLYSAFVQQVTK